MSGKVQWPGLPVADAESVEAAIVSRRAVRRFLATEVPQELVMRLLHVAARAPSGSNMQPWRVHVLTGPSLRALVDELARLQVDVAALASLPPDEYQYYPAQWRSPYLERRRQIGGALYQLLRISRGDKEGMARQHARNYCFFDAPVGLIFTIDRSLAPGSLLDYGMFLQNIMVAARAHGLDTCPQGAFMHRYQTISRFLSLPSEQMLLCGMALGHADPGAVENRLESPREEVSSFATFHS